MLGEGLWAAAFEVAEGLLEAGEAAGDLREALLGLGVQFGELGDEAHQVKQVDAAAVVVGAEAAGVFLGAVAG